MRNVTKTLRALALFTVSMFVFVSFGFAQQTMLLTESFEAGSGTTPPAGWVIEQVTGTQPGITFVTTQTSPTISAAYDGTRFVSYNSYGISSGSTRLKRTAAMSTVNKSFVMVDFAWYENPGYSTSQDKVDVQWSTNGTTWNTAGTFLRYNAVAGWKGKNVVLPAGANNQATLYVAFLFTSAYGNNCAMDLVHVTCGPPPPPAMVTIGTGTATAGWPYYTFYYASRTQMLYTAAELTAAGAVAGQLQSVGFNIATVASQTMNNFAIKMGNTSLTALTGWVSGLTSYYTTAYSVPGTGWRDITLTTPFIWDGTSNVIVEVCFANTSYTSNSTVYSTAGTSNLYHYHADLSTGGCTFTNSASGTSPRPNIRFGVPPISPGVLMGYVRDVNTSAPIAGAIVQVGTARDTSRANGMYIIYNIAAGAVNYTCTSAGYIAGSGSATIVSGQVTTQDIMMNPGPKVGGVVTDASTGNPITGATIKIAGTVYTMSIQGGSYLTPLLSVVGNQPLEIAKTGFDPFTATVNLVPNQTFTQDAALLPTAVAPGPFVAALNNPTNPTAVNLNWQVPQNMYQLIYDDGVQDDFAIWATANNLNALKFTPLAWPVQVIGGKVNLGNQANYPSNALPLNKFMMYLYKADGTNGTPGTKLDSVEITPAGFGWADFAFAVPITITTGDFYLVMKQGGIPPHAAGLGIDLTNVSLRSYSKFVTGGAPWIPAAGTFQMRAIVQGVGGPLFDNQETGSKQLITAAMPAGLIYETPVATQTGYESVATVEPFEWSSMQNTLVAPELTTQTAQAQPASETGVGSNFVGAYVPPTDAPAALLFDNGPIVNSPGTGFGGADESMLQTPLTLFGSNFNKALYYRMADDFVVSGNPWNVTSVEFYGYQTGSTTTSTFTGAYIRIMSGVPGQPGTTTVWGDTTTNRLSSTTFTNCYRVSVTQNNQRPIMKIVVNTPGLTLPAGTYWIEFCATGSLASGPWCPPITINATPTTGNGLQFQGTTAGYVPWYGATTQYQQGVPFKLYGTQASTSNLSYQVWRLLQGEEGNQAAWTSIYTGGTNSTVDNSWPSLPNGPYRWAVKAIYSPPGQRFSPPTFSNVIGKGWLADVNVCVSLTCAANPKAGTQVELINVAYPDTNYMATTDTSGCVHFTNVWKGNYTLRITRFTYPVTTQNVTILGNGPFDFNIFLLQNTDPPTNLAVNNRTLKATWSPPRTMVYQLNEPFTNLTTNQWTISPTGNWALTTGFGNPAPSLQFNWTPTVTNYHHYVTSKVLAGIHAPIMKLKYDIYLSNFSNTTVESMGIELWNGTTWTTLKTWDNQGGSFPWTTDVQDITSVTHNPAFRIRFHAFGSDSYQINNWNIDNVQVYSTDGSSGPNPCVIGYNFYLNGVLSAFTPDTNYNIPPNQVVYGQTYQACVKAVYGSGYSPQICVTFTSNFLYPARDLTAQGIECNAYLTWKKPQTLADGLEILDIQPRTEMPNVNAEYSPMVATYKKTQPVDNGDALWDLMFAWSTTTNQETAVVCIGDFIYTCRWSGGPTWFYKYQKATGVQVETFDIPGSTANRDFAFDNTNAYATGYTATINKLDFNTKTIISSLTTSGAGSIRHISYDQANNGFWVGDWATLFLVSATTGNVVATGPSVGASTYGTAYDPDPAGPFLWVHTQDGSGDEVHKYKITGTTVTATGISKDLSTYPGWPGAGSIAGGLETIDHGGKFGLLSITQTGGAAPASWLSAIELRAGGGGGGGGTPQGLIGYNIYRGTSFIHYNPHPDSITYYDYNLNPGTYKYDVTAVYDLTPYGFPGQQGESLGNTAGVQTINVACGYPLPFYEPWDQGQFAYHNWSFAPSQDHWSVNTGIGNPAPSADFTWQPAEANYSYALVSPVINASPWTCASIWLDFDLKLIDRNNTGKEKLTVDLFYNGTWHQKAEYANNGSTDWMAKHIDISAVKGKAFRIRFVANGVNSADLLHWYVDNIHAYGICNAADMNPITPASQSHFTTTLTWVAPTCGGGGGGTVVDFIFDDGTAENGWSINPGYVAWIGNEFPITASTTGVLQSFKIYFMANPSAGGDKPTLEVFNGSKVYVGTTAQFTVPNDDWVTIPAPDIPFTGPFYAMVKWNNFGSSTNYVGADENGPYVPQDLAWYYDGTAWDKLSVAAGTNQMVMLIRATALVDGDVVEFDIVPGAPSTGAKVSTAGVTKSNRASDSHDYSVMGVRMTEESDSSQLVGYNIWRTAETGIPPYNKLNAAPLTATTYTDTYPSTLVSGIFKYYVTTIYKNSDDGQILCEPSSDTVMVTFPAVGMNNDLTSGQIMVYPNPATEVINVKSDFTITRIDVMNFVGQTVYTNTDVAAMNTKISVATLKSGVYFVKVTTTEGVRSVKITVTH